MPRSRFRRPKPYKYILQPLNMASKFPQFKAIKKEYGYDFVGILKPTYTEYTIRIIYGEYLHPKVFVLNPEIISYKHRYEDGSLCIYKLSEFKWRKELLVSKFIVPLTAMWLHFYEIYTRTGEWFGPEAPHDNNIDTNKKDENTKLP